MTSLYFTLKCMPHTDAQTDRTRFVLLSTLPVESYKNSFDDVMTLFSVSSDNQDCLSAKHHTDLNSSSRTPTLVSRHGTMITRHGSNHLAAYSTVYLPDQAI